jgi:hypothetical protein
MQIMTLELLRAAAYTYTTLWLAAEIRESIDDPRPSIPHNEVMAEMEADIAALPAVR